MCVCVCVYSMYITALAMTLLTYLSRQETVVIIVNLFAVVQVQFDPKNYTVTEGDVVNITLVTSTSDYMFNFTVTLQNMDGTATGESCSVTCMSLSVSGTIHNYVPSHPVPCL